MIRATSIILFLVHALLLPLHAEEELQVRSRHNLDDNKLAIQGYDPVSYFDGTPTLGMESIEIEYKGIHYRFSNTSNRDRFTAASQSFEPQYGGWCAYAMLDDKQVEINPERFKIINQKLYLYYDAFWGNTCLLYTSPSPRD